MAMPAFGLYTHIRANRWRSGLLLGGLFFLVYLLVYAGALAGRAITMPDAPLEFYLWQAWSDLLIASPFATVATLLWLLIAYRFNEKLIGWASGSHGVTRREEPRLYNLLENLCISRGIPMPKLKIIDTPVLNAFASGLNEKQYTVTVTTGLLERLDDAEIEAVLAHELTHIRNGDVRLLVIALIIAGVIGFVAEISFRMMFHTGGSARPRTWSSRGSGDRKGGGGAVIAIIIAVVLIALAWFLSQVIRYSLSRSREFLADAGAVELTKNPDAMITALRKIDGRGELPDTASAVMEMCIDNPRSGLVDLFATHPSIDARVEALVKFAGGRDPGPIAIDMGEEEHDFTPEELAAAQAEIDAEMAEARRAGAVGAADPDKPFLPAEPPLNPRPDLGPWTPNPRPPEPPKGG
jgi:heat shock protein HtpX